jgi:hypothetical protein
MVWYDRSVEFWDAVLTGSFEDTYQRHHPGVTTMWIAGLGLRLYAAAQGWSSDMLLEPPPAMSGPQGGPAQAGTAALGMCVAACVVLIYVLLVRIVGWSTAFCAGFLLALDPFYITHSKMIHVDALLASLMLISALFLISCLRKDGWAYLVLSGIFAGLAFLTKSPSLFLIPYAASITILVRLTDSDTLSLDRSHVRVWGRQFLSICYTLTIWILVALCIFFLLWPVMWSEPWSTLSKMAGRVQHHVDTPHPGANFFAGRVADHLGLLYYMASLAWKTTLVTLPAICTAVLLLALRGLRGKSESPVWYVLAYALGFLFMMTLGAKKWSRYILPTFVALDVLAAWGLVQAADIIGRRKRFRGRNRIPTAVVVMALAAQATTALRHHPYYGTHHNLMLGGSRLARHVLHLGDQGEGLDLAACFLNRRPAAQRITAGVQDEGNMMFRGNFVGDVALLGHPDVDYKVFYIHNVQRDQAVYRWREVREVYNLTHEPIWSVSFDGVPYAWIIRAYPDDPEAFQIDHPLDVQLGRDIRLLGHRLSSNDLRSSDALTLTLFWQSTAELAQDYHVFVHLQDENDVLVAQHDGVPLNGERPTWSWQEAEVLRDEHKLFVDGSLPEGKYTLSVGMYDYPSGTRLPAVGSAGHILAEGRVVLQEFEVASLK